MVDETTETKTNAEVGGLVEPLVSCGYCMNCKHFKPLAHNNMGSCQNVANFHIGYSTPSDEQITISGAIIEGDEGWGWMVGRNFGCIHFEKAGN